MSDPLLLTAQLIQHRNDMRRIMGPENYETQVSLAKSILRGVSSVSGKSIAESALSIAKIMDSEGHDPSIVFAAFVDISEAAE